MFGISLSGIKNSQKYLDVTSNNIANANTIGFKKSRAEFADLYSASVFQNHKTSVGMGSQNVSVSQQFVQGNLSGDTGNNLDMAIQGNGFFVLSNDNNYGGTNYASDRTYTRAGAFQVDKNGFIVTAQGDYLQGWNVNDNGDAQSLDISSTQAIKIPADTGAPNQSSEIGIGVNLPASAPSVKQPTNLGQNANPEIKQIGGKNTQVWKSGFDPKDSSTYTCSTSQTIHDSLGGAHTLTYYMIKSDKVNAKGQNQNGNSQFWNVVVYVDGKPVDVATANNENPVLIDVTDNNSSITGTGLYGFQIEFGPDGKMKKMIPSALFLDQDNGTYQSPRLKDFVNDPNAKPGQAYPGHNFGLHSALGQGVSDTQDIHINFDATQYGSSSFSVNRSPTNDGYSTGLLTNVTVSPEGIIQAEYTNGRYVNVAKVAMADFANPQGLSKVGDTQWKQSILSGEATPKEANRGGAGSIKGANLEESNVDLTASLVDLIVAQRNYQANSQALQTQNTAMDSIMNIR